jgi:LmbE family N-acetylglucosaminyl deacetylase
VPDFDPDEPMGDGNPIGLPEEEIHWRVDVTPVLDRKRAAMQAHSSQTTDIGWMLAMPAEAFVASFGTEYYREPGRDQPIQDGWPFD